MKPITISSKGAVLITGTSSGIGKATAEELLAAGYTVFGTVRKLSDGHYLKALGGWPLLMDVRKPASIQTTFRSLSAALGSQPLVALINNAGICICGTWECMRIEDIREIMEVNFMGLVQVVKTFLPLIKKSKGRIILVSSTAGRMANAVMGAYSSSKFAVEALADSLRQELYYSGVKVISVMPGPVRTPIFTKTRITTCRHYPQELAQGDLGKFEKLSRSTEDHSLTPQHVAKRIHRLLVKTNPPARLLVARSPLVFIIQRFLPIKIFDWLAVRIVYGDKK